MAVSVRPFLAANLLVVTVFCCATNDSISQNETDYAITDVLRTAIAWGLVPMGAEVILGAGESFLKENNHLFLMKLLNIHSSNMRRATSQHLTDNLSARLENFGYKTLSNEHNTKKTGELQRHLVADSLNTFSILSLHAQKARKTYFRLQDIIDTLFGSAQLALIRDDSDQASAIIALAAQTMVYVHPEFTPQHAVKSIQSHLIHHHAPQTLQALRPMVSQHLRVNDPLYRSSALIRLRYCAQLNTWEVGESDCEKLESDAIDELGEVTGDSSNGDKATAQEGLLKRLLADVPPDQIRTTLFVLGVSVPGTVMYFMGKQHPAVDVVIKHFAKVIGLSTTKENMERFASQSRRGLEKWGAISNSKSTNGSRILGEYANDFFSTLQRDAGKLLAEQPNFARSNVQRTLELLTIHLSDAYRAGVGSDAATSILAGALVHNIREMVETDPTDTVISAAIRTFRPLHNSTVSDRVRQQIPFLDREYEEDQAINQAYNRLIYKWESLSSDSEWAEKDKRSDAHGSSADSTEKQGGWAEWLPTGETAATALVHTTALGYNVLTALAQPYTVNRFKPAKDRTIAGLGVYYFVLSMIDFGLRSIGEPAIVHMQTVFKNQIGSSTGILDPDDALIQEDLASRVIDLNRRLSLEAQMSRSYKTTMEALLVKCWALSAELSDDATEDYVSSATVMAYAAYLFRYFHPEFSPDDIVVSSLAKSRFAIQATRLREHGLMQAFASHVMLVLAQLDPNFSDPNINSLYRRTLASWGINVRNGKPEQSADVLDSWVVYGDWLLGGIGFTTQALSKAVVHNQGLVIRSLINFAANVFEFGTTDPLRKRIYALARLNMLRVVFTDDPVDRVATLSANQQLTDAFRREKFYFGKPELDMRTQLVGVITSVVNGLSEARFLLVQDRTDRATDLIALCVLRLALYAPDQAEESSYISESVRTISAPFTKELAFHNAQIQTKVAALLLDMQTDPHWPEEFVHETVLRVEAITKLWRLE